MASWMKLIWEYRYYILLTFLDGGLASGLIRGYFESRSRACGQPISLPELLAGFLLLFLPQVLAFVIGRWLFVESRYRHRHRDDRRDLWRYVRA
jgi:hypothetical protein